MLTVTLSEVKAHLRLESDYTTEDSILQSYVDAAEKSIENWMNRTWANLLDNYGEIPADLKIAVLKLTESMYKNRGIEGAYATYQIPYQFKALITPYTIL